MSQTLPATAQLGAGKAGLSIGYRVLNLDRTTYSVFTTMNVSESPVGSGTYNVSGGIVAPDAGGYVIFGVSGTDYAESAIDPAPPTVAAIQSGLSTLTASDIDARLAAYDAATGTEATAILAAIAALNNLSSAGAQAAAAAALAAYDAATGADVASVAATVAASNPASADSATINIHAASSYSGTLTGLTIPVSWTSVALTMKRKTAHADSKAVLQIIKTNGGDVGDGLTILNGSTSTTKADASLSVNQGAGSIAVTIADAATAALAVESYRYDVKVYYGDSDSVATAEATANVTSAVTLAT